jgi:pimeloyl-ACP methyl ester carboxylesterase
MAARLPDLRGTVLIDGAGHWTQQEAPEAFNRALLEALAALDGTAVAASR